MLRGCGGGGDSCMRSVISSVLFKYVCMEGGECEVWVDFGWRKNKKKLVN